MSRPFPPDMFQREQSTPKITQQLERRFTNGLLSVKDQRPKTKKRAFAHTNPLVNFRSGR